MVNRTGRHGCPDATGSLASAVGWEAVDWAGNKGALTAVFDAAADGLAAGAAGTATGVGDAALDGLAAGGAGTADSDMAVGADGVRRSEVVDEAASERRTGRWETGEGVAMGWRTATVTPTPRRTVMPATATVVVHRGRRCTRADPWRLTLTPKR